MDNALKQQIDSWTEADEHDKIIELLEKIPSGDRDFETTGLLARAYNYNGQYEKALALLDATREEGTDNTNWHFRMGYAFYFLGKYKEALLHFKKADELTPEDEDTLDFIRHCHVRLPFRKRVDDFWQWFAANETELSRMVEKRNEYDTDEVVKFVSQGTDLLSEDVHFNLGGNYEFTFSVEGHSDLFYLYPYLVSRLPEPFKEKWHFSPFNPGTDSTFSFGMYGVQVDMANIRVTVSYEEERNDFDILFYEQNLCSLPEAQSYNAFYIMMEIMLGEGVSYQYIADVKRADELSENMIPLPALRGYIRDTLESHNKKMYDNPREVYTSYRFEPEENEELRYDIVAGSTCFTPLLSQYYQDSTELFDHINRLGAQAVFLAFPFANENEGDGKKVLDFRYELEDRLEAELLKPEGLGLLLGGAIGQGTCYIDLLLFDQPAFIEKVFFLLKEYPQYRFYLSDFRQHGNILCLSLTDQE